MVIENDCIMYEVGYKDITKEHPIFIEKRNIKNLTKKWKKKENITLLLIKQKSGISKGGELREIALTGFLLEKN